MTEQDLIQDLVDMLKNNLENHIGKREDMIQIALNKLLTVKNECEINNGSPNIFIESALGYLGQYNYRLREVIERATRLKEHIDEVESFISTSYQTIVRLKECD